jgi:hypothetical protein
MEGDDPSELRRSAAHCRRLAAILYDQTVVAEILEIAAHLEAKALRIEVREQEKAEKPQTR